MRSGIVLGLAALCACHAARGARPEGPDPGGCPELPALHVAGDTVRGVVLLVGADPLADVVLRPAAGPSLSLVGPPPAELRALAGLDVALAGRPGPGPGGGSFEVRAYAVRGSQSLPAVDGCLERDHEQLLLRTPGGGRVPIGAPPPGLEQYLGGRVWVAGPPERPESWGVLVPPARP